MSLILEALRKSEAERRRGAAPDVAMELPPAAAPRARAMPAWLLPALAGGLALAAAAWWFSQRDAGTQPPSPAASGLSPQEAAAAPAIVAKLQARAAKAAATVEAPPPAAPPRVEPVQVAPQARVDIPAPPPSVPPPPPEPRAPTPQPVIDDAASVSMPSVKLSMHMWDETPARRFVILNGQRMVEGDRNGDLTLVAIERDGVLVERNGQRARIPLP